jgi:hypothetical protein
MAHLQFADGEDSLRVWSAAANVLNKEMWTAENVEYFILGVSWAFELEGFFRKN